MYFPNVAILLVFFTFNTHINNISIRTLFTNILLQNNCMKVIYLINFNLGNILFQSQQNGRAYRSGRRGSSENIAAVRTSVGNLADEETDLYTVGLRYNGKTATKKYIMVPQKLHKVYCTGVVFLGTYSSFILYVDNELSEYVYIYIQV